MKAPKLLRILRRSPLAYEVVRQSGSHRHMEAEGRPKLLFAFHDSATVPTGMVRKVLCKDVGLTEAEALELL